MPPNKPFLAGVWPDVLPALVSAGGLASTSPEAKSSAYIADTAAGGTLL